MTEREAPYWRISHERFLELVEDEKTLIHDIRPASNEYGEFLFVTTSRPGEKDRICMTFYGLGYHEYCERWISKEWFWYQSDPYHLRTITPKEEFKSILERRITEIQPYLAGRPGLFG